MRNRRAQAGRAWSKYQIRVEFRAPLDFAFAWCTDFSPEDSRLEGERYQRKVIERTLRRVVFEDLEETGTGWVWSRDVVDLRPPDRWHPSLQTRRGSHRAYEEIAELGRVRMYPRSPGTGGRGR